MRSIVATSCCLFFLALLSPALAVVEVLPDFVGNRAHILVLIPYNDLYFQSQTDSLGNVSSVCHSELSLSLENMDLAVYYQDLHTIRFSLPDSANLANKAYPYEFSVELEKGAYFVYTSLFNKLSGGKLMGEASIRMPGRGEEVGALRAVAWRWGSPFLPRTPWPWADIDSLSFRLPAEYAQGDSAWLHLPSSERQPMTLRDGAWTATVPSPGGSGCFSSIKAELLHRGATTFPACELLTSVYTYQSRYTPRQQLAQLRYVINSRELRKLSKVPPDELQAALDSYWAANDPTPGTEQNEHRLLFYGRVEIADQRYTIKGGRAGWQSDRGRIFIKYGEPDEVTENVHPIGVPAYIIWRYYDEMKEYVFYDYMGFGDYELRDKWEE